MPPAGELAPTHDPGPFELAQSLGEDVGTRVGQTGPQVGKAFWAKQQLTHDQQRPTLAHEIEGVGRGAPVVVCAHSRHAG